MVAKKKFKKKYRKKNKKTALPTVNPNQKLLLPTHIHLVDGTLMVLVNLPVNKNQPLSSTQDNLILLNKPSNTPSKIKLSITLFVFISKREDLIASIEP